MTAAVLSIGTEITRGEITNTNGSWLCEELTRIGLDVTEVASIPDDRVAIRETLERLTAQHDLIVSTGGLGPTTDDITTECVAGVLGVPLERDAASLEAIRARMTRFGRTMSPSNAKQADFPRGAAVLANPNGTAPGFSAKIGHAVAFFMPGVPSEMKPMFAEYVVPVATQGLTSAVYQVRLKTFGAAESAVNDRLAGIETAHGVIIGYRAHFPEIEVKVLARAPESATAEATARRATADVTERLGDLVFAEGDVSFASVIGHLLRDRSLTLGTAESCTGGLVGELLTEEAGASDFFRGAIVAYDNRVKTSLLGVDAALIAREGAVSEPVARAMAEGARRALGTDFAISVTGIAGPGGGTPEKPVGLVHYALATPDGTTARKTIWASTRRNIRHMSAYATFRLVRDVLLHGHDPAATS
jgi:nicotinamide-nucleotide amidase